MLGYEKKSAVRSRSNSYIKTYRPRMKYIVITFLCFYYVYLTRGSPDFSAVQCKCTKLGDGTPVQPTVGDNNTKKSATLLNTQYELITDNRFMKIVNKLLALLYELNELL